MYKEFVEFVRDIYGTNNQIPLHAPVFRGNEKNYLLRAVESSYVSSVGEFVDDFELMLEAFTGSKYAIATVNGTSALHVSLLLSGVDYDTEVLTQSLSFVATCNAIYYCGARPLFIDVARDNFGMSAESLREFLQEYSEMRDDGCCWSKVSNKRISACVPVHVCGFPFDIDEVSSVCNEYNIPLIEDAAESLGSFYRGKHTGTFGIVSAVSFNGNKIVTTGGGGMILTSDEEIARKAKHVTTTARLPHRWSVRHDRVAYNYRLPNINAALGVAQMEQLESFIESKRKLAKQYQAWGKDNGMCVVNEAVDVRSNYWLNSIITNNKSERDDFLLFTNNNNVMTRPLWEPMHTLEMNAKCHSANLKNTEWLFERVVNIPSGVI